MDSVIDKPSDQEPVGGGSEAADVVDLSKDVGPGGEHVVWTQVKAVLKPLASLRITVTVFAFAIVLVLAGSVAQIEKGVWTVVDQMFRKWVFWLEFKVFFPREWGVPGGIFYPGGWLIGTVLLVNLLAAHTVRFKAKARGTDLLIGLVIIAIGSVVTWFIIDGAFSPETLASQDYYVWGIMWRLIQGVISGGILFAGCWMIFRKRAGIVLLHGGIILMLVSELIYATATEGRMLIREGEKTSIVDDTQASELVITDLSEPGKRREVIFSHAMLKTKGRVLTHEDLPFEIEILKYMKHTKFPAIDRSQNRRVIASTKERIELVEKQIERWEENIGALKDLRAQYDRQEDKAVADQRIAETRQLIVQRGLMLKDDKRRQELAELDLNNPEEGMKGLGRQFRIKERREVSGTERGQGQDVTGLNVRLKKKGSDESLGLYAMSLAFYKDFNSHTMDGFDYIRVDGKLYSMQVRCRRIWRPYEMYLRKIHSDTYVGTSTPRNFQSDIILRDPTRDKGELDKFEKEVIISMNNPYRMKPTKETFYQHQTMASFDGRPGTVLLVVQNNGWIIPYIGCMIVGVAMAGHFLVTLVGYLKRRAKS